MKRYIVFQMSEKDMADIIKNLKDNEEIIVKKNMIIVKKINEE